MRSVRLKALEFNLTEHCNLACAGCDHDSPALPTKFASHDGFADTLATLARSVAVDEFKLLGGEPLLHPNWTGFAEDVRRSGIAKSTALVTNGLLLHRTNVADLAGLDTLRVSLYPGIKVRCDFDALRKELAPHRVRVEVNPVTHFRETLLDAPHEDDRTTQKIYRNCKIAHRWSCHTLYEGRIYKCPPAALQKARFASQGWPVPETTSEGIVVDGREDFGARLKAHLRDPQPLAACRFCLGSEGDEHPHRQLSREERSSPAAGSRECPSR